MPESFETYPVRSMDVAEDSRNGAVSFDGKLAPGEKLTGVPTEESPDELTIDDLAITSEDMVINGETVAAGRAVTFSIVATTKGFYKFKILCDTDATVPQKLVMNPELEVTACTASKIS